MLDSLELEVNANGVEEIFVKRVLSVPEEEAGLANSTVSDDQHLEQIVTVTKAQHSGQTGHGC